MVMMTNINKLFILLSVALITFLFYQNSVIQKRTKELILEKNKTAELYKFSDSLQVARAVILEQRELNAMLKQDRTLHDIIKKQRGEIASLVTSNSDLILQNLVLSNIINEQVWNPDGTVSRDYEFNYRPDNNVLINGYTTVIYADSLAKPVRSTTAFKEISFKNIVIDFAHVFNKESQEYRVYAKTDYPYLTLDSTSVTYSIKHTNILKPKTTGVLLQTGLFRNFNNDTRTTGVDIGLGWYYKNYSIILNGRSDQSAGLVLQKRF